MTNTTPIPGELLPLVHVRSVDPGFDQAAYLASTVTAFLANAGGEGGIGLPPPVPPPMTADDEEDPVLAGDQELRLTVPEAQQVPITTARDRLLATLRVLYRLPDGDLLVGDALSVLAQPFGSCPSGTVVYQRTTSMGVIDFVLSHIILNTSSGTYQLANLPAPAPLPARPPVGDTADTVLAAAFSVAQNLAFALPPPWGPAAAAAISLLNLLIPSNEDNPFDAAVQSITTYLQDQLFANVASYINQYAGSLQSMQAEQGMLGVDPVFMKDTISQLQFAASVNSPLYVGIAQMNGMADSNDDALKILVLAESIYTVTLKMIIQLYAKLAEVASNDNDDADFATYTDAWYAAYATLLVHVQGGSGVAGCAQHIADLVQTRTTNRLSQISPVFRASVSHTVWTGRTANVETSWGWTYTDAADGVPSPPTCIGTPPKAAPATPTKLSTNPMHRPTTTSTSLP